MKNLFKALCFLLVFALLFTWLDNMFYSNDTGWEATDDWGQQFDIVFMGNSHVYCNINPVIINDALGLNTIVLASSSQPSEVTYYNLKTLLKKTTPKALVIEANILNSSVDHLYKTNREGLIYNSITGIRNPVDRAIMVGRLIPLEHWLEAYSSLFRPLETWTRFSKWDLSYTPRTILGYETKSETLKTSVDLLNIQHRYQAAEGTRQNAETTYDLSWMEKILRLAQEKVIPVYIIKSPISSFSAANSNMMYDVAALSKNYTTVHAVHDYNLNLTDIGLTQTDFYDGGHLNSFGAVKFTEYLAGDIGRELGINPDFSKVGWFRGEHCEPLDNDMYRYTVDLYDGCLIRFTATDGDKKTIASTDFSHNNSIDLPRNCILTYEIKAENPGSYTYDHPQTVSFILKPSPIKDFNNNHIDVVQNGNTLTVTNSFNAVPVQYAWYVYKGSEVILKQMYTKENSNSFSYAFTEPGSYKIQAFIRTMDKTDMRSITAVNVTVEQDGLKWK